MANVPSVAKHGKVIAYYTITKADSDDPGSEPDEVPLTGQITFEPLVDRVLWSTTPSEITFVEPVVARVYNGLIYGPDQEPEGAAPDPDGVWLLATSQPYGQPNTIQWRAVFLLDEVLKQPDDLVFNVLPDPQVTDITLLLPAVPKPPVVYQVSNASAQAAATSAQQAATYDG